MKTSNEKWINCAAEFCLPKRRDSETDEEFAARTYSTKYIKFVKDVAVKAGQSFRMKKYEDHVQGLFDKGFIKPEELESRMERKSFVKYVLDLPPHKGEAVEIAEKPTWINNAVELRRGNEGEFYLMVKADFTVKKGDTIPLKRVTDNIADMQKKGMITAQEAQQRVDKLRIKDADGNLTNEFWLIYTGSVPPAREGE